MDNQLLRQLTMDDLSGENHALAETIGLEAFIKLVETYGGTGRLYIPQADMLLIPIRDKKINEEYNGGNIYELCKKWGLSESYIRKIVQDKASQLRRAPCVGQVTFDDIAS